MQTKNDGQVPFYDKLGLLLSVVLITLWLCLMALASHVKGEVFETGYNVLFWSSPAMLILCGFLTIGKSISTRPVNPATTWPADEKLKQARSLLGIIFFQIILDIGLTFTTAFFIQCYPLIIANDAIMIAMCFVAIYQICPYLRDVNDFFTVITLMGTCLIISATMFWAHLSGWYDQWAYLTLDNGGRETPLYKALSNVYDWLEGRGIFTTEQDIVSYACWVGWFIISGLILRSIITANRRWTDIRKKEDRR